MSNLKHKKRNRILVTAVTAAVFAVCSSVQIFAADSSSAAVPAKVIYTGDGTTKSVRVENADNLDTFKNLMPGGSTGAQQIVIANRSSKNMTVYFQAVPTDTTSQKLLDELQLTVTFKLGQDSAPQTLYSGPASGTKGTADVKDIAANQIRLGFVYGNTESGVISATLSAPEKMGNEYQLAQANLKWVLQFELADVPSNNGGGGGGGGGGGNGTDSAAAVSAESISPDSTPLVGPSSSPSSKPSSSPEKVPDDEVPLSNPPKTGQDPGCLIPVAALAAVSGITVFIVRRKIKKNGAK